MGKATRQEVYEAIDGEREYQDSCIAHDPTRHETGPDSNHSVGAYLTMLAEYVRKAQQEWTDKAGHGPALEVIRKVAGIAVHCMEDHGAPKRVIPTLKPLPIRGPSPRERAMKGAKPKKKKGRTHSA
ncbi:MAG: hypothetical protein RLZZ324_875 [Candidatus Parcubacteria bacterium]|jgi:hypothetical protein